jgi:hypothetical protein
MAVQVTPYVDVKQRCVELNCNIPTGLALLPRNFDTVTSKELLIYGSHVSRVRSLWQQAGIVETPIERPGDDIWAVTEKEADWIVPTILIGASFLCQNSHLVSIALGVIANYLTDLFKGNSASRTASVNLVVERMKDVRTEYVRIQYEGGPEGIADLVNIVHEVSHAASDQKSQRK